MSEPDFRRLDDAEPPVATDSRLDAVLTRGRRLRRRRNAVTAGAAMAAIVVVVALAGAIGLVRAHVGPSAGVPAAGGPANPPVTGSPPPTIPTEPTASPPASGSPVKISQVLSTDGVGPYLIGIPTKTLQAKGLLAAKPVNETCPDTYLPLGRFDSSTLRIVADGTVSLVEASGLDYVTPSGAYVGMPEVRLTQLYGPQLLPVDPTGASHAYTVGTTRVVGFAVAGGQVTYLLAGSKQTVMDKLKSGTAFDC